MINLLVALSCMLAVQGEAAAGEPVPDWFQYDPGKPHEIFDAWRGLSTREAALYWRSNWNVLAGVLKNEKGEPMPFCNLAVTYNAVIRSYHATLRTDENGYFAIYGPPSVDCKNRLTKEQYQEMTREERLAYSNKRGCEFSASPGFPYSQMGYAYAREARGYRLCTAELVMRREDRAFYVLTCDDTSTFDPKGFEDFRKKYVADNRERGFRPWRDKPRPIEDPIEGRDRRVYEVRLVSPEGKGIPDAIVKFMAYDDYVGNRQTVETDDEGRCTLEEYLLTAKPADYYKGVRRRLSVDAPGYGVGPVPCDLRQDQTNTITLETPAAVSGTVLDHNGNPMSGWLRIEYHNPNSCSFELRFPVYADRSFSFERLMPGQPFRIVGGLVSRQTTPRAPTRTEEFILKPGQHKQDIHITVPMAAAIRGIVVDAAGRPVTTIWGLSLLDESGGHGRECRDGRFGFQALGQQAYRLRVRAAGFEEHLSQPIQLEPGELRFVRIQLERDAASE